MSILKLSLVAIFLTFLCAFSCSKKNITVAFYNVENLFDTLDDKHINDNEFLPDAEKAWNAFKYQNKLDSLAKVIAQIGGEDGADILGLCEVENRSVLEDLSKHILLADRQYQIIHFDSPDRRGIDVALLCKSFIKIDTAISHAVTLEDDNYFKTRDILYSKLSFGKETLHVFVNHWPSRSGGEEKSMHKRMRASEVLKEQILNINSNDSDAKILAMGDFNDEPDDASLKNLYQNASDNILMFNTMLRLDSLNKGSYCYRDDWNMLDQILISQSLVESKKHLKYESGSATIFEKPWLKQSGEDNRYAGYPFRTWGGNTYLGGFSDHFPVYIRLD